MYNLPGIDSSVAILSKHESHLWLKINRDDLIVLSFDHPVETKEDSAPNVKPIVSYTHDSFALNQYL